MITAPPSPRRLSDAVFPARAPHSAPSATAGMTRYAGLPHPVLSRSREPITVAASG